MNCPMLSVHLYSMTSQKWPIKFHNNTIVVLYSAYTTACLQPRHILYMKQSHVMQCGVVNIIMLIGPRRRQLCSIPTYLYIHLTHIYSL